MRLNSIAKHIMVATPDPCVSVFRVADSDLDPDLNFGIALNLKILYHLKQQ
jgi:hypothetical protein